VVRVGLPNEEIGMSGLDLDRELSRRWLLALGAITVQG
jgi:hypothetical protein